MAAVNKDGKFRVSLYKALLFLHVQSAIKSGGLNLEHSSKYRPLDDYLIDRTRWQRGFRIASGFQQCPAQTQRLLHKLAEGWGREEWGIANWIFLGLKELG